jgi:hypothetical protein
MPSPHVRCNGVKQFGHFSIVASIEVVGHLYDPRSFTISLLRQPEDIAYGAQPLVDRQFPTCCGNAPLSGIYHGVVEAREQKLRRSVNSGRRFSRRSSLCWLTEDIQKLLPSGLLVTDR